MYLQEQVWLNYVNDAFEVTVEQYVTLTFSK